MLNCIVVAGLQWCHVHTFACALMQFSDLSRS